MTAKSFLFLEERQKSNYVEEFLLLLSIGYRRNPKRRERRLHFKRERKKEKMSPGILSNKIRLEGWILFFFFFFLWMDVLHFTSLGWLSSFPPFQFFRRKEEVFCSPLFSKNAFPEDSDRNNVYPSECGGLREGT